MRKRIHERTRREQRYDGLEREHRDKYGEVNALDVEYELDTIEGDAPDGPILITLDDQHVFRTYAIHGMDCSDSDDRFDVRPELTV